MRFIQSLEKSVCNNECHQKRNFAKRGWGLEPKVQLFLHKNCLNYASVLNKPMQLKRITKDVWEQSPHPLGDLVSFYSNHISHVFEVVIVITFYSPSCLGQETAKGPFGLRVKLPPAHLSTTHGGGFILSL